MIPTTPAAAADEAKWTRVSIPTEGQGGGWVLADGSDVRQPRLAIDGTLYAYGKGLSHTLYKSADGGESWSDTGEVADSIVDIATAPDDANSIYYATKSRVYHSTDGGKNFVSLPAGPGGAGSNNVEITTIDVSRGDSRVVAVGTRDTDNGQYGGVYLLDEEPVIPSWEDSHAGSYDVYAAAFSPNYATDRQLVAVVTDETDTLVTSRVGDEGWGATIGDARLDRDNSGTGTAVAVANQAAIAFPSDYDATGADCVLFVAIDSGSGNGDVYKISAEEAPGSSAATDLNIGAGYGQNNVDVSGLAATGDGTSAKVMGGAASEAQVYFSDDGGKNWTRSRKEPTGESETYVLMAPDFNSSGQAYAATSGSESAFSISRDSGVTWNQAGLIDTYIDNIIDLAPSPRYSQDNTLFMLTFGAKYSAWQSGDGGEVWERIFASSLADVDSIELVELSPEYGEGSQAVFLAGSGNGRPALWKSSDNGQSFKIRPAFDPDSGEAIAIDAWGVVDDNTLFIGSYDGSNRRIYRSTNSGFFYEPGALAGTYTITSVVFSPDYEKDETILTGNRNGWVYWSNDNGASFEPLPADATSAPLSGVITVAFDADFSRNNIVYAASNTADKGIYRFTIGSSSEWERIDSSLPSGSTISQVTVSTEGVLYAANSIADGGMERCLNPDYSLGPTFETVTRGLSDNAALSGLWQRGHQLWAVDSGNTKLLTFTDSVTSPVSLTSPADDTSGIGTPINYTISNVSLDWEIAKGATGYEWQFDHDTDFSSIPSGFEGTTKASSARLPSLEPATTYYWRVRASAPVLSPWSEKWSFTTSLDAETTTLGLENPKAGAPGVPIKPLFQWQAVPGADAYELLVAADILFANPAILKTGDYALSTTAWQADISLDYGTAYYWKVSAVNADTRSAWSPVGAFTTESPPATTPPASPSVMLPMPFPAIPPASTTPAPAQPMPPIPPMPPAPAQSPATTPDWVIYLIGTLVMTILLLVIAILVLATGIRRN